MKSIFSQTLSAILLQKRLKQVDLAKRSGVSHSIINRAVKHGTGLSSQNYTSIIENTGSMAERKNLISALLKDRASELNANPDKVYYSDVPKAHNLATELLPLFSEISALRELHPGVITAIKRIVLLARATVEEIEELAKRTY